MDSRDRASRSSAFIDAWRGAEGHWKASCQYVKWRSGLAVEKLSLPPAHIIKRPLRRNAGRTEVLSRLTMT